MTDADRGTFDRAFGRVAGAFRLRLKEAEMEELSRTYFRVLSAASLDDVLAAGKACISTSHTFPKPAEWLHALPTQAVIIDANRRVMATDERVEYWRAETLRYQDDPCGCVACQAAGVPHRPLRFVPNENNLPEEHYVDKAVDTVRNRIVVTGRWIHGAELARWYVARDNFYACTPKHSRLARALIKLVPREPGEEG